MGGRTNRGLGVVYKKLFQFFHLIPSATVRLARIDVF